MIWPIRVGETTHSNQRAGEGSRSPPNRSAKNCASSGFAKQNTQGVIDGCGFFR
jgi:hypothetical protein